MFIQTENTPNPLALKFIPGRNIMESGSANFTTPEDAARSPLAALIFAIPGVDGVFYGTDFISVTKTSDSDWCAIKPLVMEHMANFLSVHEKISIKLPSDANEPEEQDAIIREIKELIDSRVRPAVAMDGGDIVFDRFEDGVVYLEMQGACSGCPSSSATLKGGIENMLRYYIPEVLEVRSI